MPTGFVSAATVMAGAGQVVRRAAYNARQPITIARTESRYRPQSRDDYIMGRLLVPQATSSLGSQVDTFWNRMDLVVTSTGPIALDLILGLPREDELEPSEAMRLLGEFAEPLVQDGHAVQFDLHALPRSADLGSYFHAHVLIGLFGLDGLRRIRRLETQWTAVFRASSGDHASANLPDWRRHWIETQSAFFRKQGLNWLRVPADVGLPEVRIGPRSLQRSSAVRLELARHREERQGHYRDDNVLLDTLASQLWLLEPGDVFSTLRSIFPLASTGELRMRTKKLLGSAIRLRTGVGHIYGTTATIKNWNAAYARAIHLADAPSSLGTAIDGVQDDEDTPDWFAPKEGPGGSRLAVMVADRTSTLFGTSILSGQTEPVAHLIERYRAQAIPLKLIVPGLRSRFTVRHLIERYKLQCVTVASLLTLKMALAEKSAGEVWLVTDAQAVPDPIFADLLASAERYSSKLILLFDRSKLEQHPSHFLSTAVMQQLEKYTTVPLPTSNPSSPHQFSWDRLAARFEVAQPREITGIFEEFGLLSFESLDTAFDHFARVDQIIVPDDRTARAIRQDLLTRDLNRVERSAEEQRLTLPGEPAFLDGDLVCLARDRQGRDYRPAGALGRLRLRGSAAPRWEIEWDGSRSVSPAQSQDRLVHACALPLRLVMNGAAARSASTGRDLSRVIHLTRPDRTDIVMRFAAASGGVPVVVDPAVAIDGVGLTQVLAMCRSAGRSAAVAQAILDLDIRESAAAASPATLGKDAHAGAKISLTPVPPSPVKEEAPSMDAADRDVHIEAMSDSDDPDDSAADQPADAADMQESDWEDARDVEFGSDDDSGYGEEDDEPENISDMDLEI